jgi:predicted unusual protein kinase regulating ubiquinone biosynthesis (AarF/ABC1/UbiB family)
MLRKRYRRITSFFARVLIGLIFWELVLPRVGFARRASSTRQDRLRKIAKQFRTLAIEMGGVMIKVGQFLSSRVDVLPPEVTAELSGLQDEVPPEDFAELRKVAESEFDIPLSELFAELDEKPLAAASLGQAHLARIKIGEDETGDVYQQVVVKIQRPNIEQIIDVDLDALKTVGGWISYFQLVRKRADVPALLDEFTRILHEEIDYLAEGKNAETFARNFKDIPEVRVPKIFWSHTTKRVLTLEDVQAIKINDYRKIEAAGLDRGEVARRLLNTYLKQIFEDGFFHGDPHPGNLFVHPSAPGQDGKEKGWLLTFVDFGMVAQISPPMLQGMREMVIGVATRDASRLNRSYQMLGILLPGADLSELERVQNEVFDRFWGKDMSELTSVGFHEIREFAYEFRGLLYAMPFQVPEDLIMLGRSIGILSGMCTGLDPHFNVWEAIAPFAKKLIAEEDKGQSEEWFNILSVMARRLIQLPGKTEHVLDMIERGNIQFHVPKLTEQVKRLERAVRLAAWGIVFVGLLLGGIQLVIEGISPFGEVVLSAAVIVMIWMIINSQVKGNNR